MNSERDYHRVGDLVTSNVLLSFIPDMPSEIDATVTGVVMCTYITQYSLHYEEEPHYMPNYVSVLTDNHGPIEHVPANILHSVKVKDMAYSDKIASVGMIMLYNTLQPIIDDFDPELFKRIDISDEDASIKSNQMLDTIVMNAITKIHPETIPAYQRYYHERNQYRGKPSISRGKKGIAGKLQYDKFMKSFETIKDTS